MLKKTTSLLWLLLCFSVVMSPAAWAKDIKTTEAEPQSNSYYKGKAHGYYYYEDPAPQVKEEPEKKPEKPASTSPEKNRYPSLKDYSYEQLWYMHPDDFSDLNKTFHKKAVQYPTEENALEVIVLNDITRRKAVAYASVMALVSQKHPEYSNVDVYPNNNPARLAERDKTQGSLGNVLSNARDEFALIMFTRDGCKYCDAQKSIVNRFLSQTYGWSYREANISRDSTSSNLAESLGVEKVPSMIVVYRETGEHMPVSTGVVTFDELTKKLYWSIRYLKGETSPEQYLLYDFEEGTGGDPLEHLTSNSRKKGGGYETQ